MVRYGAIFKGWFELKIVSRLTHPTLNMCDRLFPPKQRSPDDII
ncbi:MULTISPECIES: hypothetical protein [Planktothricoides]|uniref:Uncharacterized protein n=1 Tax=Planktothricoides raciborskii GIHE-MW2 TaxID=2792601 RepID=A0AAU8JL99_9CYAN|nr:hypothetical protein [Planktothricoides sp. SR001]